MSPNEFKDVYEQARRTRAAVRGFINYLKKYEGRKETNADFIGKPWTRQSELRDMKTKKE